MHDEYDGATGTPVISLLECSINGAAINVELLEHSRLASLHATYDDDFGSSQHVVTEKTQCNYGVSPELASVADRGGMRAVGIDELGEVRAIEVPDHPFFIATLYLPQLRSSPTNPHPLFQGFIAAASRTSAP